MLWNILVMEVVKLFFRFWLICLLRVLVWVLNCCLMVVSVCVWVCVCICGLFVRMFWVMWVVVICVVCGVVRV